MLRVCDLGGDLFTASLLYIVLLRIDWPQQTTQAFLQFLGDLLLVTGLVYFFHGTGTFSILYLLVIICASTILERRAGIAVATGAWSLYAFTTLGLFFGALPAVGGSGGVRASTWLMSYKKSSVSPPETPAVSMARSAGVLRMRKT